MTWTSGLSEHFLRCLYIEYNFVRKRKKRLMEKNQEKTTGKNIRCKAAICKETGKPLVIEEIEVSPPKEWEVRVKILCASLCHSDVTFWKMSAPLGAFPRILGHEAAGIVESVGEKVTEVKEGDFVIPVFLANCQECIDCKSEKSNLCSTVPFNILPGMPRSGRNIFTDSNGNCIYNLFGVSSFSQYTVVDIANIVKVHRQIPPDKACVLSCGVSTGISAAWKIADVKAGSTVAIFGLGAVGLGVAEGARQRGASKIIGVDLNPGKFEIGKQFGLTNFINPKDCGDKSVKEVIHEMTKGGADYCFECIGLASVMNDAFTSSRLGWGKTIVLGVEMQRAPLSISSTELLRGKSIEGSLFGGIKAKLDIPLFIDSYLDKGLKLEKFITHEVGLHDVNKAFDLMVQGEGIRCIIWMDK